MKFAQNHPQITFVTALISETCLPFETSKIQERNHPKSPISAFWIIDIIGGTGVSIILR